MHAHSVSRFPSLLRCVFNFVVVEAAVEAMEEVLVVQAAGVMAVVQVSRGPLLCS